MTFAVNILLAAICLYLVILGIGRYLARSRAQFQALSAQTETREWLQKNLSGRKAEDIGAIRRHFGLSTRYAQKLLNQHKESPCTTTNPKQPFF